MLPALAQEPAVLELACAHCVRATSIHSRSFLLGSRLLIAVNYLLAVLARRSRSRRA